MEDLIQNVVDALSVGSLYALTALGIALIFGVMRLINFAHGELIMGGAYAATLLAEQSWFVLVIGPVVAAGALALLTERAAFRPLRDASPATLLVTSFGVSYLFQNVALLIFGSQPRGVPLPAVVNDQITVGDVNVAVLHIITTATTLVLLFALALFLRRTPLGIQIRASAEDFVMARLLGVRADVVIAGAFAISGVLAGVVSLLLVSQTGIVSPTIGLNPLLIGLVATVIGGMASLPGAVLGGYILGVLTMGLDVLLPATLRVFDDAFLFAIVITVLLFAPDGILGTKRAAVRV